MGSVTEGEGLTLPAAAVDSLLARVEALVVDHLCRFEVNLFVDLLSHDGGGSATDGEGGRGKGGGAGGAKESESDLHGAITRIELMRAWLK